MRTVATALTIALLFTGPTALADDAGEEGEKATLDLPASARPKARSVGLSVAAGPFLLMPTPQVATTGGVTLELQYFPPLFANPLLRRVLGVSLEGGWHPLSGHGENQYSAFEETQDGPRFVTTEYQVDWDIRTFPMFFGFVAGLSRELLAAVFDRSSTPLGAELFVRFGGTLAFGHATASLNRPEQPPYATDNTSSDLAAGLYFGVGAAMAAGPGHVMLEYRYANVRLDFEFPVYNPELGELGGNLLRAAYRLDW